MTTLAQTPQGAKHSRAISHALKNGSPSKLRGSKKRIKHGSGAGGEGNSKSSKSRSSLRSNSEVKRRDKEADARHQRIKPLNLSSLQDEDDRAIFDLIRRCNDKNTHALENHLQHTKNHLDVTSMFNDDG